MGINIGLSNQQVGLSKYYKANKLVQQPYLGNTLFGNRKVQRGQLRYYVQNQPAMTLSKQSSLDANTVTPDNHTGFQDENFNTQYFRTAGVVNEQDIMDLHDATVQNNDQLAASILESIYDDQIRQLNKQAARREQMTTSALSYSKVDLPLGDPIVYASNPNFQHDGDDWDNPNSDIFGDIRHAKDELIKKGIVPNQMIMNINTFRKMQKNNKIKTTYSAVGTNVDNFMMLQGNLVDAIKSEFRLTPVVYNQGYNLDAEDMDDSTKNPFQEFIPDDLVIFLNGPIDLNYAISGNASGMNNATGGSYIGYMNFAPTVEELKANRGALAGDLQLFDLGVAFRQFETEKTAQTETSTVQNCLPSFEQSRSVFRLTVGPNKPDGAPKYPTDEQKKNNGQSQGQQNDDSKNKSGNGQPATA
ncbi:major capsid protein [Apilactobacillus micheneri]|uniref:major capsid protein n=1 Tax=Apilactobacillus micheneri TaxID=1899430 RepID=UPI000D0296EC|nr:major capsid protein [Apilactobacillus micheneri]